MRQRKERRLRRPMRASKNPHVGQIGIVAALVIPIILLALSEYGRSKRQLTHLAHTERQSIASLATTLVRERLDNLLDVGSSFASDPQLRKLASEARWEEAIALAGAMPRTFPFVDRVFLADTTGTLRADSPPLPRARGRNLAGQDWYQGVRAAWEPYVSEVHVRAAEPRLNVIAVAIPILADDWRAAGILVLQVRLETVFAWTKEIAVGKKGFVYVVDQRGRVVAHPRYDLQRQIVDLSSVPSVQRALEGERGVATVFDPVESQDQVAAYERVPLYGWAVVAAEPAAAAFAARDANLNWTLFLYGLLILLNLLTAFLVVRNANRLKEAKRRLTEFVAKEHAIIESIGDGVIATDERGEVIIINPQAEVLLNTRAEDVLGRPLVGAIAAVGEDGGAVPPEKRPVSVALATGKRVSAILTYSRADGTQFPAAITVTPIRIGRRSIGGAIEVIRDVSAEREVDRLKSEFVSLASHQLRTPLTSVRWSIELLTSGQAGPLTVEQQELLAQTRDSVTNLIALVSELLNLSRIESGRLAVNPAPTNLGALAGTVAQELASQFRGKGVVLDLRLPERLPTIPLDPMHMRQIILNFLSNALKYTPEGGRVRLEIAPQGSDLRLSVTDTGIGIPESERQRLFQRFFRASNVQVVATEGTGLGLYLARSLVELAGGRVGFKAEQPQGSTFWFTVPLSGSLPRAGEVDLKAA